MMAARPEESDSVTAYECSWCMTLFIWSTSGCPEAAGRAGTVKVASPPPGLSTSTWSDSPPLRVMSVWRHVVPHEVSGRDIDPLDRLAASPAAAVPPCGG